MARLLALATVGPKLRRRQFAPRAALILGIPALAGIWIGGGWVKAGYVPEPIQLAVFTVAALVASRPLCWHFRVCRWNCSPRSPA